MMNYCGTQTRNLANVLHQQNSQCLKFYPRRRLDCNISGKMMRMEDVLLIYFEQIVSFCACICSILAPIRVNFWFHQTKTNLHKRGSWCWWLIPSLVTDNNILEENKKERQRCIWIIQWRRQQTSSRFLLEWTRALAPDIQTWISNDVANILAATKKQKSVYFPC